MSEWNPDMSTAPADGTWILLYRPGALPWGKVCIGAYDDDAYARKPRPHWRMCLHIGDKASARAWIPTHWMALPATP